VPGGGGRRPARTGWTRGPDRTGLLPAAGARTVHEGVMPPPVAAAMALAARTGFTRSCRPEQGELLRATEVTVAPGAATVLATYLPDRP
jgi:hypothetical protein